MRALEDRGLLSSDMEGRSKTYQMLYSLDSLMQKLSAVSGKIENPDSLIGEMYGEGLNYLNRLCDQREGGVWGSHLAENQYNQLLNIQSIFGGATYHPFSPPLAETHSSDTNLSPTNRGNQDMPVLNRGNQETPVHREPLDRSLQDRLSGLRSVMTQLMREYDAVDKGTILDAIQEAYPDVMWTRSDFKQVIEIVIQNGTIFRP